MSGISRALNYIADSSNACLFKIKEMRDTPLAFQKTFQTAYAAIQLSNLYFNTNYLGKFSSVAQAVNMHDFYLIFKVPRDFFFPVNADSIDASAVLASLKIELAHQLPGNTEAAIHEFAQTLLKRHLESMLKENDAYRSKEHFLDALQNRARQPSAAVRSDQSIIVRGDRTQLNLRGVAVIPVPTPMLSRLIYWNWGFANVLCVGSFFKSWGLLDTAKYAAQLGQNNVGNWVRSQCLDTWLRGIVCLGFGMTVVETANKLRNPQLISSEKHKIQRDLLVATSELAYQSLGLVQYMKGVTFFPGDIHLLAFITKGIGLCCLVKNSKYTHNYFPSPAV
ncbi:MAG: hypothetical protein H0V82_12040 [Candidatus Protochlamydia sp.]|nr:hypothetical protein [Candidatus Protochlamydia sp.]